MIDWWAAGADCVRNNIGVKLGERAKQSPPLPPPPPHSWVRQQNSVSGDGKPRKTLDPFLRIVKYFTLKGRVLRWGFCKCIGGGMGGGRSKWLLCPSRLYRLGMMNWLVERFCKSLMYIQGNGGGKVRTQGKPIASLYRSLKQVQAVLLFVGTLPYPESLSTVWRGGFIRHGWDVQHSSVNTRILFYCRPLMRSNCNIVMSCHVLVLEERLHSCVIVLNLIGVLPHGTQNQRATVELKVLQLFLLSIYLYIIGMASKGNETAAARSANHNFIRKTGQDSANHNFVCCFPRVTSRRMYALSQGMDFDRVGFQKSA